MPMPVAELVLMTLFPTEVRGSGGMVLGITTLYNQSIAMWLCANKVVRATSK